ncbi:hypothetical protein BOTU111921_17270 [Bordetella tumbae]
MRVFDDISLESARRSVHSYLSREPIERARINDWCKRFASLTIDTLLGERDTVFCVSPMIVDASNSIAMISGYSELADHRGSMHPVHAALMTLGATSNISYASILNVGVRAIDVNVEVGWVDEKLRFRVQLAYPVCLSTNRVMDLVHLGDPRSEYFYFDRVPLSPRAERIRIALDTGSIWQGETSEPEVCNVPVQTTCMA